MTVRVFSDEGQGKAPELYKRTFPTHTEGIRELEAWLTVHGVPDAGLESTGVYWKPVWNALEGKFGLHPSNPHHIRAIPGSKSDQRDGTRVTEILACGKLPVSFIPPLWQRELRDLTRLRARLTQERTRIGNRIEKVLEDAQIKLGCVASEIWGGVGALDVGGAGERRNR
jgi:transposase